jgi:hypothetical protein
MITNEDFESAAYEVSREVHDLLTRAFRGEHNYHPAVLGLALGHYVFDNVYTGPIKTLARKAAEVWEGRLYVKGSRDPELLDIAANIRDAIKHRLKNMEKLYTEN